MNIFLIFCLLFCLLGMAKVTGPLFSISASGKLADAMVHFPWKGRHVVRKWLKPSNPKTAGQGDARIILGGLGRGCSPIDTASQYAIYARAVAPAGQTWVSYLVKWIRDNVLDSVVNYDAWRAVVDAHDASGDFAAEATALGLITFDYTPKTVASAFTERSILYAIAHFSTAMYLADNSKFNAPPYTKALATWVLADVELLVADFASL